MAVGKLVKVDREFTVTICDNGFMLAINGRTKNDDWSSTKVICENLKVLTEVIEEVAATPLQD